MPTQDLLIPPPWPARRFPPASPDRIMPQGARGLEEHRANSPGNLRMSRCIDLLSRLRGDDSHAVAARLDSFIQWLERAVEHHERASRPSRSLNSVEQSWLEAVRTIYSTDGRMDIDDFLTRTPYLLPHLLTLPKDIKDVFGADARMVLEVDCSGREDLEEDYLVATVQTSLDEAETLARFLQFGDVWWKDRSDAVQSKLAIRTETI